EVAARMFQAYSRYRALHEVLAMLELALQYASPADQGRLRKRLQSLDSLCESGEALEGAMSPEALRGEVLAEIRAALWRAGSGEAAGLNEAAAAPQVQE